MSKVTGDRGRLPDPVLLRITFQPVGEDPVCNDLFTSLSRRCYTVDVDETNGPNWINLEVKMSAQQSVPLPAPHTGQIALTEEVEARRQLARLGFLSSLLAAVFTIAFGLGVLAIFVSTLATGADTAVTWQGIDAYVASYDPIQWLAVIPSLPLAPVFVVVMVCIHYYAPAHRRLWSHLGLAFTLIYAVMASINYIIQLTAVRASLVAGETDGLAMFVNGNPHSIFWSLASAYAFMNVAMLFVAPVFSGGRLERWIRWLFLVNGATVMITVTGVALANPAIYLLGALFPWCFVFTAAMLLLAMLFRRL